MFAYIVRRLLWAVILLFLLSVVTFSIFYLVPRWAGEHWPLGTWAGPPPRKFSTCGKRLISARLSFSTGTGSKASSSAPIRLRLGRGTVSCPTSGTPSSPAASVA